LLCSGVQKHCVWWVTSDFCLDGSKLVARKITHVDNLLQCGPNISNQDAYSGEGKNNLGVFGAAS